METVNHIYEELKSATDTFHPKLQNKLLIYLNGEFHCISTGTENH